MANSNKVILITGAGGHIGAGFVAHYLAEGMQVIAVSSRADFVSSNNLMVVSADFTKVGAGLRLMDDALEISPKIDHIINNAARQDVALLKNESSEVIQDIFRVNLTSIAEMYSRIAQGHHGVDSILNITSIEATIARVGHSIYGASKAALESLTKTAAQEIAPVRSNALRLGLIEREGIRQGWPEGVASWEKTAPLARMGTLKDVLRASDYLLGATWMTGSVLTLDGGIGATANW